ncbi:MAG: diguanylate cyclase [Candidatus Contendobacter sp.]|nr:diguanylate cyclase [Candidatus Contendobacter sp.]
MGAKILPDSSKGHFAPGLGRIGQNATRVVLESLEKQNELSIMLMGLVLIVAVGVCDFLSGYEISFSVFYVIPISLVTWFTGRWPGIMASLISAVVWLWADAAAGNTYSNPLIPMWNSFIRLSFFVIITSLLSTLRIAMEHEKELSRTDNLTGAANSRSFYELASMEIERLKRYRHSFTLVYIDLDNFKTVNDQFGHAAGDQVLCTVVNFIRKHIRRTDMIARLGGDEFALLLPQTNQESARVILLKIQSGLLEEMRQNNWPITFSMGVLTCIGAPSTTDDLVRMADALMYLAKHEGKNAIKYSMHAG